ncbi:unnamed protein product [Closterium sp. NIES-53]
MTLRPSIAPQRSTAASALVAELVDFAAACGLDFTTCLVAESASESVCSPSVGGECALGTDVLEDRQEEFECFSAAVPHLMSMLIAPEGDPDAPDILTPRSYAEAIEGPYSSQWQAAMDPEMASWKSTGTYVDEVPLPGENIVSGMWIFKVKRSPGSPPVFKARYRDYELHSLDFSTAFLQGSLHEEIWLRRPPGFTGSFPAGTQWSLRRPVYRLCQAPLCRAWGSCLEDVLELSSLVTQTPPELTTSSCEAEIYAGAMAAQERRWLIYLLTDLGEAPRSPPVLYVDNKAMLALCQEHRLEHRTKHIALRYFLA